MSKSTIEMIQELVTWLDSRAKSTDITSLSQALNKLSVLSSSLSQDVTDAYALANEFEDNYKIGYAKFISESELPVAKSERAAEVAMADAKRDWTTAKNGFRRLSNFLERTDRVMDTYRQYNSIIKATDLKHLNQ